ncbi:MULTISPECIES: class I SAM-dependent methyltransferase [Bacillus]|uniref:class I SAM-dependent methyltransferase n=1 Tax=Bacillus TaxID=1386 RepID=UPI00032DA406|nr:class I SAM-dependent methyltransferase [Bacillus wiedmannii]EOP09780.1 methyltransferase [Bacillus cereus BAG2O-3]EOQ12426.1 methyltransferase [Bacillus cereus B5-2]MBJ8115483.1 class I SAM-dependent methyltransferase [Bacillus cereus]PFW77433.1 class I SAM-dependent methyltransferase [Bacillus sp. AFS075960]RFB14323.1 class I SAM-dependent methyltransferase [Bacillus sp. OE]RFB26841.1 class I SAM-dependent methyltransferase [Bacillus sp. LB(2018)]RFB47754.1 class I SAM-dependent methylt
MTKFNWHESAEKKWDNNADFWNQNSQEMWDSGSRSTIIPFFEQYVEKEVQVLDVGCGDGYGTYKLSLTGYKAVGVDLSEVMIQKGKERGEGPNLSFIKGDLSSLPFENEKFEAIMAINSLEWTEEPLRALNEIKRVLKKDGYACIAILGPTAKPRENSYPRLYGKDVVCNTMMPWEFEQLAKEQGFEVVDGIGVYKRGVNEKMLGQLPTELQQSLTFLWVFMLKNV